MPHSYVIILERKELGKYDNIVVMTINGILIGLFLVALGLITLKYNRVVAQNLGTPQFVWRFFGPGRENSFYLLLSCVIIILGLFVMFGLFRIITSLVLNPFKGLVQ